MDRFLPQREPVSEPRNRRRRVFRPGWPGLGERLQLIPIPQGGTMGFTLAPASRAGLPSAVATLLGEEPNFSFKPLPFWRLNTARCSHFAHPFALVRLFPVAYHNLL